MEFSFLVGNLGATETEHLGARVLPAPAQVAIDGKFDDWDLSGGVFACGDVENQRDKYAVWVHLMWDRDFLYVLGRWNDPTPVNNPRQVEGGSGWEGDSLQFRTIVGAGADIEKGRCTHWTCWQGTSGRHVMDAAWGRQFNQGHLFDAQAKGGKQAITVNADASGYVQELAIPWNLIAPEGWQPKAGEQFRFTLEPNMTVGTGGRLTIKDIFAKGIIPDRVFTFMAAGDWGLATLEKAGSVEPTPVRLADKREFKTRMEAGVPVVDWTGLIKQRELAGFSPIAFEMPFDGYVSLNIYDARGGVARQLLNQAFFSKGKHEVKWDGLTTFSFRRPGDPVAAGAYTWAALVHPGLDLKLVGWACNGGNAPWDANEKSNWGGDHGAPICAAAAGDKVFLGWSGAEAAKALLACDTDGAVQWKNIREGMAGCTRVAADGDLVFGVNAGYVYRLNSRDGSYAVWPGKDTPDLHLGSLLNDEQKKSIPDKVDALDAADGVLYLASTAGNAILAVDAKTGQLQKLLAVPAPTAVRAAGKGLLYVCSGHNALVALDAASGQSKPFADTREVYGLTTDAAGNVYAAVRGDRQQVVVFDAAGKEIRTIGRKGGRARVGKWDPTGMLHPEGLAVDAKGQLWVAENDTHPKRFSAWKTQDGAFVKEFFGASSYGALGGAICPTDPHVMIGQSAEWRIDPQTGKAVCLAVITAEDLSNARFATGTNGRTYLFTAANWAFNSGPVSIFERLGDAQWKLRGALYYVDKDDKELPVSGHGGAFDPARTMVWADANDNGQRDAGESTGVAGKLIFSGWYMSITADLSLHCGGSQFRCTGFTACGAPQWDLSKPVAMPAAGLGSSDGRLVLAGGGNNEDHARFTCFDIATGKQLWWYPDNFNGVHGSHKAPPPEAGLIRGAFNPCGTAKLPEPIGNIWVIPSNIGEWHVLTERGFYLSRVFQGDPMRMKFPEQAVPGALMNDCPPGMGGEDFGGSICLAKDGKLYLQAGKTGYWNIEVANLDKVQQLKGGAITISEKEVLLAQKCKEQVIQANAGVAKMRVAKGTPTFAGNLEKDFAGAELVAYERQPGTRVRTALMADATHLYAAWEVQDKTPWVNGAKSADALYVGGDTVDLQLGTDPAAPADRKEAAKGDLRLSIGNLQGKDAAVIFRKVADKPARKTFSSGVIKEYVMDSVVTPLDVAITTTIWADKGGYTVEAAIPLSTLELKPAPGLTIKGDVGVTFANQSGDRTRLRSYWSNQAVGIVDDVVFELMLEPANWGELTLN